MVYSRRSTKSKITRDRYSRKLQAFVMTLREEEKTAISSGQGQIVDDSQLAMADLKVERFGYVDGPSGVGLQAGPKIGRSMGTFVHSCQVNIRLRPCHVMLQTLGSRWVNQGQCCQFHDRQGCSSSAVPTPLTIPGHHVK